MKIFVEKEKFAEELKLFQGIFEKKTLMDILQNIKVTATDDGNLELVATDLEIGLVSTITVDVKEPGTFTVNGRDFHDLISRMPEGNVEISENNDLQIIITNEAKTSKYKMLGMQSSDYPKLPEPDFSAPIHIALEKLAEMIDKNYYIISPEMKFNLGGALMSFKNGMLEMAATDGHRLAYTHCDNENPDGEPVDFIVSRKTLLEILKLGGKGDILFSFDKNNIFFKAGDRILSSRIIDQKFPNYQAVIPEKTEFKAVVEADALLKTLRRILVFKTRNNGVVFKFNPDRLILERTTPDKGEAHDEVVIKYDGKPFDVAFNGNFIIDFLTHVDSSELEIGINDVESSFTFKPIKQGRIHFVYVVMPLNI